ncbi:Response regulator receiver domain-containing protein [Halorientalis persicus]|jgi:GAF domain-containing protein|uniref:Response regulator receiver domain-containing protein n=1 Tax=Halorientalis persicus TaxID=1367881 RepID=A0A1H8PKR6_9EURY|nr:GAF domain-containing protein [Halorientalis persicus]SEO42542.1 Response regulator receiver domain-containing protein [Halorientalis persicus]
MPVTVLYAHGDDPGRTATAKALSDAGLDVREAVTLDEAVETLAATPVDCVATAYDLPDGNGLELCSTLRETTPDTPCILFTDVAASEIDTTAFEGLVAEYLPSGTANADERLQELIDELVTRRSQVGYPLPDDEDARLAALEQYEVAGQSAQDTLDRLTELASRHFDVHRAFVGVVGVHEERFLSCQGPDLDPLAREKTMCTHAILEPDVLVVEDTRQDARFEHNDALERLDIRAYAGAPLRGSDGAAIGSFCLTDDEPRSFSEAEIAYLRLLADEAAEQLDLRRQLRAAQTEGEDG